MEVQVLLTGDPQFEALLNQYDISDPKLEGECKKTIDKICMNPACSKSSLMCENKNCQSCGSKAHNRCLSLPLNGLTCILGERSHKQRDFLTEICSIQNKFVEELYISRRQLTKKYYLGDLEEKYLKIFDDLYKKEKADYLKGKQAREFYERLMVVNEQANENAKILIENYKASMKNIVDSMVDLKNRMYDSFVKATAITDDSVHFDSQILRRPFHTKIEDFKLYDSLVVKHSKSLIDELAAEQCDFLKKILNKPKNVELLYRASENGYTASNFHSKCDKIPNTLVLVRTEFGKTIGGFTQYNWNAVSNSYVTQAGKKSFIFSLDMKQKMVPINENNLIYCHTSYGPTFGSHDIYVSDQCHNNNNSYSNFPISYNVEGQTKYQNNQNSYKAFSGATNGKNFRVLEYEVFRVVYS